MRVVHIQTTIQTVFGVLDDDGDIQPRQPVTAQLHKFTPEAFTDAQKAIEAERDRADD